jgi:hypothetical protein
MFERISNNNWTVIIVVVNVLLVAGIILMVLQYNIEKSIIVYWILYPIILMGNLLVWLVVKAFSSGVSKRWGLIMIIMLIAYLPLATLIEKTAG